MDIIDKVIDYFASDAKLVGIYRRMAQDIAEMHEGREGGVTNHKGEVVAQRSAGDSNVRYNIRTWMDGWRP